jgi:hypothetical protein
LDGVLKLEAGGLKECAILNRVQGFLTNSTLAIINTSPLGIKEIQREGTVILLVFFPGWGGDPVV